MKEKTIINDRHQIQTEQPLQFADQTFAAGDDLFRCLQVALDIGSAKDLCLTPERWKAVSNLASKMRLGPLLFKSLPVTDSSLGIPTEVTNCWFREYLESTVRNNILYGHLKQVLDSFEKQGITAILLKGIYLMDSLYAERGMRTISDIDLLIHPQDKKIADSVMQQLGYGMVSSLDIPDPIHYSYRQTKTRVIVELHFGLATGTKAKPDLQGIWDRSHPIETIGKNVRAMATEDCLVNLCLHFTHHLLSVVMFAPRIALAL